MAHAYVVYREARHKERLAQAKSGHVSELLESLQVKQTDGTLTSLDRAWLQHLVEQACVGIAEVSPQPIFDEVQKNLFNGVAIKDIYKALVMSARTLVETEPNYSFVTARLLLQDIYEETTMRWHVNGVEQFTCIGMNCVLKLLSPKELNMNSTP